MRSVDVVLPASTCAMLPILRVSSSLNALPMVPVAFLSPGRIATASLSIPPISLSLKFVLPAVMGEGLVGFRHAVHIFLLLDGPAARIGCVDQFIRQLIYHRFARALPRILQPPANGQPLAAKRIHLHR